MALIRRSFFIFSGFFIQALFSPLETVFKMSFLATQEVFAEVLATAHEVLQRNFKEATAFEKEPRVLTDEQMKKIEADAKLTLHRTVDRQFLFYVAKAGDRVLGYAVDDVVAGKWGPMHYLLTMDPQGVVTDVTILEYKEKRGKPVAKNRFTRQFVGKKAGDPLAVQKDIQGVTGASISSKGITNGIRKLVHVFKLFY